MIILPLMLFCSRRFGPVIIREIRSGLAILLVALMLMPNAGRLVGEPSTEACYADPPEASEKTLLLREGTRIPPTTGRIVMLGRRWVFIAVSERDDSETVTKSDPLVKRAILVTNRKRHASRLGQETNHRTPKRFKTTAAPVQEMSRIVPNALQQILLNENLMLQRIVEAIQADATDEHWIISGEVTEFFNENRLSIQLAQRANRH